MIGYFEIEDDDIVRLKPPFNSKQRVGWINVGAFAVHVEIENEDGDLKVELYPCANEFDPLGVIRVTRQQAMAAGATDLDAEDVEDVEGADE